MDCHKALYDFMLENGELKKVYPRLTGEWEADKKKFKEEQNKLEKLLDIDVK